MPWHSVTVDFERCLLEEPGSALQPKPANITTASKRNRIIDASCSCGPRGGKEQPPFQRAACVVSRTLAARLLDRSNSAVGSTQDGNRGTRKSARQSLRGSTK